MNLVAIFFYLFLASIPFGTRVLIHQFTMGFHEYEAVFVYASDVFLVLFFGIFLINYNRDIRHPKIMSIFLYYVRLPKFKNQNSKIKITIQNPKLFLAIFLIFSGISIFFAYSRGLAIYDFVRLVLLVLMAMAVGWLLREKFLRVNVILGIIVVLAVIQSGIGIGQFFLQSDLGLSWLGEPDLDIQTAGIAKLDIEGGKILRAYGTFPHPNVLGAFLLLGLCALYYFWIKSDTNLRMTRESTNKLIRVIRVNSYIGVAMGIFLVMLGLILTFSRAAWAIVAVLSLFSILYFLFFKTYRRRAILLLVTLIASGYALVIIFSPYIFSRAKILSSEPAVVQRLAYNEMAVDLIKDRPLGVGIGNQILYSVKTGLYEKFGMTEVWQWQPIHNIYLLIAGEVGIMGLLAFLIFLISLFFNSKLQILNPKQITNSNDPNSKRFEICPPEADPSPEENLDFVTSKATLAALLLFGLFDHFLWTLQPGRLMLWLVIGILMGVNSARSTMDSAHPSEG